MLNLVSISYSAQLPITLPKPGILRLQLIGGNAKTAIEGNQMVFVR